MNKGLSTEKIEQMMEAVHASGHTAPTHSSEMVGPQDHAAHLEHAELQVHNQPLASLHFVAVFFFGVSCAVLFLLYSARCTRRLANYYYKSNGSYCFLYSLRRCNSGYSDDFKHHSQWPLIPLDGSGINKP
jgi:hypothetical protein